MARARVRDAPWDAAHWNELADLLFRRGDFDLAAKAYRRVQEIYLEASTTGPRARHPGPRSAEQAPRPAAPAASSPAPAGVVTPPLPEAAQVKPSGNPPSDVTPSFAPVVQSSPSSMQVEAVPKVPILKSSTGQTRAIRLPGTNILVSVTGYAPSPSTLPPPRRLRSKEEGSVPAPTSTAEEPTLRFASRPASGGSDEEVREVLQRDMQRFLRIFDRPKPETDPPS